MAANSREKRVQYGSPKKTNNRISGWKPANCIEYRVISNQLSVREASTCMTDYINQDPESNCCTLEADNKLTLWKATVLPVKLTKTKESTTLVYNKALEVESSVTDVNRVGLCQSS